MTDFGLAPISCGMMLNLTYERGSEMSVYYIVFVFWAGFVTGILVARHVYRKTIREMFK